MRRAAAIAAAVSAALALPATASAHAVLLRAVPSPSGSLPAPPREVRLVFSEPVEPRFAAVSVTDAAANQQIASSPQRAEGTASTLVVPLKRLESGWFLVYWRVISADGHPVRGAFTFAVGTNPGPAPQFAIPSISETAATPRLLAARWLAFVLVLAAVGIWALRVFVARPVVWAVPGTELRAVSRAFVVAALAGLVAIPVYVDIATAQFALRSAFDLRNLVPVFRTSAFGRAYVDLELSFALFVVAGAISIALERKDRAPRSVAQLLALLGSLLAASACLVIPGLAGHAAQTSPRAASLLFDWLHLAAAAIWVGGLLGLLVLWRSLPAATRVAALVVSVPRFSNVAFLSVVTLITSGVAASLIHLPTLATLWATSYGQALLVKIALLVVAMLVASGNLVRTVPRLRASGERPELGTPAAVLLRRLVSVEAVLVAAAVFAAVVLSSLPPPSRALAAVRSSTRVGPGPVATTIEENGYGVAVSVRPNRAAVPNTFTVRLTKDGRPVRGAAVTSTFAMLDMEMGRQAYAFEEKQPGVYTRTEPALVMVGHWGVSFDVRPRGGSSFKVTVVDKANG